MTALPSASATSPPAPAHHPVSSRCSWVRLQCFLLLDDLHGQVARSGLGGIGDAVRAGQEDLFQVVRSEEHTSELQSLMRISYAVFCLKKKKYKLQGMSSLSCRQKQ